MNEKKDFLAMPNKLIDRILQGNLTGVEIKVLLLCVRFQIGYDKDTCTPSLTTLEKRTGHSRKFLSRVLKSLVEKGYLQLVTPPGFRRPAEYRVLLEWDSPIVVGLSNGNGTGESHHSGTESPTAVGHYIDNVFIDKKNIDTPISPFQGDFGNAEKRVPDEPGTNEWALFQSDGICEYLHGDGEPMSLEDLKEIEELSGEKTTLNLKLAEALYTAWKSGINEWWLAPEVKAQWQAGATNPATRRKTARGNKSKARVIPAEEAACTLGKTQKP